MRTITIEIVEDNNITIREGDTFCDRLTRDEMLGSVAELTHPKIGVSRFRLMDEAEHLARERRYAAISGQVVDASFEPTLLLELKK